MTTTCRTLQCPHCCHHNSPRCSKDSQINKSASMGSFCRKRNYLRHSTCSLIVLLMLFFPNFTFQKRLLRPHDACYDDEGNPRECKPPFDNIALKKVVKVTETCGVPKTESFCKLVRHNGRISKVCDVCEKTGQRSYPAAYLTDINDNGNITYWQSKIIRRGSRRKEVSLTISFGKKYELSYISLQFHSPRPASMIIYKSMNNGHRWVPYQYYARNCQARFRRPSRDFANRTNEQEVLCLEGNSSPIPLVGGRVVFNPTRGRPSQNDFENSYILQDWVTATDIKIVLNGVNDVSAIFPISGVNPAARRSILGANARTSRRRKTSVASTTGRPTAQSGTNVRGNRAVVGSSITSSYPKSVRRSGALDVTPSSAFYAINDITIGGRCKCNGHASRCIPKNGRLACDCKHNTDGVNCEKCKAFHHDRPWKRATKASANACVACNCNLHAKKCRFNAELFVKSGGVSGGVCQKCRHHTTGRYCHFCKPGYYKNNKTKSIAHRKICKRIPTIVPPSKKPCVACKRSRSIQLTVNKWCKVDYAVETKVVEQVPFGKWVRVTLDVVRIYKRGDSKLRRGLLDVRIRERYLTCICPRLKKNKKYLLLGKYDASGVEPKLAINKNTIALRWKNKYKRKLFSLLRRARSTNAC